MCGRQCEPYARSGSTFTLTMLGFVHEAALANLALHARLVICGALSKYNAKVAMLGPCNPWQLLVKRPVIGGFMVIDHSYNFPLARAIPSE